MLTLLVVLATACSGTGSAVPTSSPTTAPDPASTSIDTAEPAVAIGELPSVDTAPARVVTASVRTSDLDVSMTVPLDSGELTPFGRFASCSGLRSFVGTYSVLVSDLAGPVRSISLITDDPVTAPGIFTGVVRIERSGRTPLLATGTITIEAGLTSGRYLAFDPEGTTVEGNFSCDGTTGPQPLVVGAPDGVLDTVEVFALVRQRESERVLGLAVTADSAPAVECPAADGRLGSTVTVRVAGDEASGALTMFELSTAPRLTMGIGDVTYEFDDVEVQLDSGGTSGTFRAAETDGLTVDGAFRCT
jgi:hypothetical protein